MLFYFGEKVAFPANKAKSMLFCLPGKLLFREELSQAHDRPEQDGGKREPEHLVEQHPFSRFFRVISTLRLPDAWANHQQRLWQGAQAAPGRVCRPHESRRDLPLLALRTPHLPVRTLGPRT